MKHFVPNFWGLMLNGLTKQNGFLLRLLIIGQKPWNSTTVIKLFTVSCYGYEHWPPLSSLALPPLPVCREPPPPPPPPLPPFMPQVASRWAYSGGGGAAARMAPVRLVACTALSSLCWKQQSAKFNIQTSRSLQPFCLPVSFPFYSFVFHLTLGKRITLCEFYWILERITRDLDLNQS